MKMLQTYKNPLRFQWKCEKHQNPWRGMRWPLCTRRPTRITKNLFKIVHKTATIRWKCLRPMKIDYDFHENAKKHQNPWRGVCASPCAHVVLHLCKFIQKTKIIQWKWLKTIKIYYDFHENAKMHQNRWRGVCAGPCAHPFVRLDVLRVHKGYAPAPMRTHSFTRGVVKSFKSTLIIMIVPLLNM